jgi:hypothetical protein
MLEMEAHHRDSRNERRWASVDRAIRGDEPQKRASLAARAKEQASEPGEPSRHQHWTRLLEKYKKLLQLCLRIVCVGLDPIAEAGIKEVINLLGSGTIQTFATVEEVGRDVRKQAGIVVMDIWNPGSCGMAGLCRIRAARPLLPVVVYTSRIDKTGLLEALVAAADG